jgi:hypothetical protein
MDIFPFRGSCARQASKRAIDRARGASKACVLASAQHPSVDKCAPKGCGVDAAKRPVNALGNGTAHKFNQEIAVAAVADGAGLRDEVVVAGS